MGVSFIISLSARPVVESATFSCIRMRSSADSTSSVEPVKAFLSNGWGPQENKLKASGQSFVVEMKDAILAAEQKPEGNSTSNPIRDLR